MYLVYTDGIRQRWFLLLYMSLNACPQQIKCVSSLREMNFYNLSQSLKSRFFVFENKKYPGHLNCFIYKTNVLIS